MTRFRKAGRALLTASVLLGLAFWGAWNIDMARQTLQIAWMSATGGMWHLRGRVQEMQVQSAALGETHRVLVYLPPGYDTDTMRRYPVLTLLHGFPDPAGDGWARFGLAPQVVDRAIVQSEIPPLIMVMPDAHAQMGKFGDGEYLNAPVAARTQKGTQIETYIARDVVGWTDANFRTLTYPSARFLGGISTGGYGAVNLGLKHPDVWGTVLCVSGYFRADVNGFGKSLWPASPPPKSVAGESPTAYLFGPQARWENTLIWFGEGNADYDEAKNEAADFADALRKSKISFIHYRGAGHHSWDAWRLMLLTALRAVRDRVPGPLETNKAR